MDCSVLENGLGLTPQGVEKFLSSSRVEGIGPVYAGKIVERFGTDALKILCDDPRRIEEIPGVGAARAAAASESLAGMREPVDMVAFLYSCGVSDMFIDRIFGKYGKRAGERIVEDPYSMVEDVWQLSFTVADRIGRALGIAPDDPRRLRGALVTAVKHCAEEGHLFATRAEAVARAASLAHVDEPKVEAQIQGTVAHGRLKESRGALYLPVFYKAEKEGAEKLARLASEPAGPVDDEAIPRFTASGQPYSASQVEAIGKALGSPVMVLTGGPGSGKTTVLRAVIEALEKRGKRVVLCAPTGRAAKRMTTLTGREAMTIHRLLGYRKGEGYHSHLGATESP